MDSGGRRVRAGQVLVILALAALVLWYLGRFADRHGFFDLKVYYGAVRYWAGGHGEIYDFLKAGTKYGFTYPPFAMLTMLPMAVLPWPVVFTTSWIASVAVTLVLIYWLLGPAVRGQGWPMWFALTVAMILAAGFEPLHETISFGQVNMFLVIVVVADFVLLVKPGHRWAGLGVGLATAVKLTPGIFIVYLLLARRFRAAAVAGVTFATATVFAMAVAPDASREYWTEAVWDTDRVGQLSYISNQSWEGLVARLNPGHPNTLLWAVLVLATLAVWVWRARRAGRAGDLLGGVALTGVAGSLVSPITWVHHLVWLLPALLLLVAQGLGARGRRRVALLAFATALYALLCSEVVWHFADHFRGWGLVGSNAYVFASAALLVGLPLARRGAVPGVPDGEAVPDLGELDRVGARPVNGESGVRVGRGVDGEAVPLVEPAGPKVGFEHP
ncbi:MAG: alpha,2-mannosyltransferase [Micromonosporaceae bacterium]